MSLKCKEIVITVILVRCKHEILMINYAKPKQKVGFVHQNLEFVITVIVINEFDCIYAKCSWLVI
jgi:hypothetical protein